MSEHMPELNTETESYTNGYKVDDKAALAAKKQERFNELCYIISQTPEGKEWLQYIEEHWIFPPLVSPEHDRYETLVIFFEGIKEAFRLIKITSERYEQKMKHEQAKEDAKA